MFSFPPFSINFLGWFTFVHFLIFVKENGLKKSLIQANISLSVLNHTFDNPKYLQENIDTYFSLSRQAAEKDHPQIIVWPEDAITDHYLFRLPFYREKIYDLAKELKEL